MKILVIVKQVIGDNSLPVLKDNGFDYSACNMQTSSLDLVAIEQAVCLKEQGIASHLSVCTIGAAAADKSLRTALAMGIDSASHIHANVGMLDALGYASLLEAFIGQHSFDLVLTGREDFDGGAGKSSMMLASLLGWASADYVVKLGVREKTLSVTSEGDKGLLTLALRLPAVLSVDSALNQPRFVKFPNLMKARKQPVEQLKAHELGVDLSVQHDILSLQAVTRERRTVILDDVPALAKVLKEQKGLL